MRAMIAALPHFEEAREGLWRHFGYTEFRPAQAEVVSSVLSGRNTVVVMPTGAGKSLCYQLPAVLLPGVTVVVSPLIALMKDQVEQLRARGIAATFINSTLTDLERAERIRQLRAGAFKLVYVAPERFRSPAFLDALVEAKVDLFAVDEAHCISQWGHDFRPDYAALGQARKRLRPPRTVALTATATPEVREDIIRSLLMKDPQVFVAGFDRTNLFLEVVPVRGDDDRKNVAAEAIQRSGGSGIIYCSTRKGAEAMHEALRIRKLHPVLYHAGMDDDARRRAQDEFMSAPDAVAVATNAFGMGIDKPDIRFVIHANIPRAVEAYYQEIGRAGRDGQPAHALLLFNHSDVYTQDRLIKGNHPPESVMADAWHALRSYGEFDKSLHVLAEQIGGSEFEVSAAVRIFEREGKIVRGSRGEGPWQLTLLEKARQTHPHTPAARALLEVLLEQYPVGRRISTELSVLARRAKLDEPAVRRALSLLERAGAVQTRRPFQGRTIQVVHDVPFAELGLNLQAVREQERRALLLLRRMTDYAYATRCRRAFILRYFGEALEGPCSGCDVCHGHRINPKTVSSPAPATSAPEGLRPGLHSELALTQLRDWRREMARELGVPPYLIFSDKALLAIATALPITREEFLRIKGTGESHWERFGAKVRDVCLMARAAGHQPAPVPLKNARRARRR
ncbi:MAG: ATP-dependent DNA helicase RecQ [Myxococcaceae bacterium]|nr:ATP-dependent DNA helicase RecQ [Myxococcaceae bacterium]